MKLTRISFLLCSLFCLTTDYCISLEKNVLCGGYSAYRKPTERDYEVLKEALETYNTAFEASGNTTTAANQSALDKATSDTARTRSDAPQAALHTHCLSILENLNKIKIKKVKTQVVAGTNYIFLCKSRSCNNTNRANGKTNEQAHCNGEAQTKAKQQTNRKHTLHQKLKIKVFLPLPHTKEKAQIISIKAL